MSVGTDRTNGGLHASGLLAGASVGSAILGWCALLAVARWAILPSMWPSRSVWALYYAVAGSIAGLQLEVTRWVVASDRTRSDRTVAVRDRAGWGLLWVAVLVGSISAVLVLASFPLWGRSLNAGWSVATLLALGALTLTGLILVLGVLVAQRRWRAAALLLGADSVVRLVATALAATFASALPWYALAIVSGSLVWVPMLLTSRDRFSSVEWLRGAPGLFGRGMTAIGRRSAHPF